jgi:S-adenosylmethionine synthetase
VAKTIVTAELAKRCEVQVAYAIGVAEPVSVMVETFGTGKASDESLVKAILQVFDLTPAGIINDLDLRKPLYRPTAAYGHFGRQPIEVEAHGKRVKLFSWEDPTRTADLASAVR